MRNHPRFLLLLLAPIALISCGGAATSSGYSWSDYGRYYAMDSVIDISLDDPASHPSSASSNLTSSRAEITSSTLSEIYLTYDALADNTIAHEGVVNVYNLNQTHATTVVSLELYDLLKFAESMKTLTNGYFNPLVGGLSNLWKSKLFGSSDVTNTSAASSFVPSIPTDSEIQSEMAKISASSLTFDDATHSVTRTGEATIDLGGIAKGYATQKVYELLKSLQITRYFVNAGTSTILFGENINTSGNFTMGFADLPKTYTDLKNCIVSTSAVSRQYQVVDGALYSHIVNPLTGSALASWHGAVLLGDDAAVGDALSTSFMLLGPDQVSSFVTTYSLRTLFYKSATFYNTAFNKTDGVTTLVNQGITLYEG